MTTPDKRRAAVRFLPLPGAPVAADAPKGGPFVAVGPGGLRMSSRDGKTWEYHAKQEGAELTSVAWTGTEFVASGGKVAYTSKDGIEWKPWPKPIPCHAQCVHNGAWVGTSWPGQMWHSKDGLEWKKCDPLAPNGINSAAVARPEK